MPADPSHWSGRLAALQACAEGVDYAATLPTPNLDAPWYGWATCDRGDWMIWFLARGARTEADRARVVSLAANAVLDAMDLARPADAFPLRLALTKRTGNRAASVRALQQRYRTDHDQVAGAIAAAVSMVLELARAAEKAGESDAAHLAFTKAATRPMGFVALAYSNRAFVDTGDRGAARDAAARSLLDSANLFRARIPADTLPVDVYASAKEETP